MANTAHNMLLVIQTEWSSTTNNISALQIQVKHCKHWRRHKTEHVRSRRAHARGHRRSAVFACTRSCTARKHMFTLFVPFQVFKMTVALGKVCPGKWMRTRKPPPGSPPLFDVQVHGAAQINRESRYVRVCFKGRPYSLRSHTPYERLWLLRARARTRYFSRYI